MRYPIKTDIEILLEEIRSIRDASNLSNAKNYKIEDLDEKYSTLFNKITELIGLFKSLNQDSYPSD